MNADGTGQTKVVDGRFLADPVWSPDGTKIAYTQYVPVTGTGAFRPEIYTADADGGAQTFVTVGEAPDWQPLPGPQPSDFRNAAQYCRAARAFMGEAAFEKRYGDNARQANAFGKCVSGNG